ncbi:MAG: SIMPL domain-containing protein [Firmicutes bacterium]|nr:SIMPL domain-containing protein [Bacillota bacterium]
MKRKMLLAKMFLVLLIFAVGGTSVAFGQELRQVHVRGQGSIKVEPDLAHVSLGVTTEHEVAEEAQGLNALHMRNILDELEKLGIASKDIETSYFNVFPVYKYDQEAGNQLTGYRVSNTIRVQLEDLSLVGEVIDKSIAAGATNVNNVQFTVKDEEQWIEEALTLAVKDARRKAEIMAAAADEKLGLVMVIRDPGTSFEPYLIKEQAISRMALMDSSAPTPIQPGQLDVSARVEIIYALE